MRFPLTPLSAIKDRGRYSMVGGPFGSKLVSADYVAEGVPVIRGGNLPDSERFSFDDVVFVSAEKVKRDLGGNLAYPGDIVVTQRGTLGQVGLLPAVSPYPRFVISQSQMKLTVDDAKADRNYVYYALKSPHGQHEIKSRALTAGVPHINLGIFEEVRIPVPALLTQRKIAAVLSAYDDLIENNIRRIKLIEEMARRIYWNWFIDFRYPGHERVAMVETERGPIPQGWKVVSLGDAVRVNARTIRRPDDYDMIEYIDIASVTRGLVKERKPLQISSAPGRARRLVRDGDVIWSTVRPNLRAYALLLSPRETCVVSTGFAVLTSEAVPFSYTYMATTDDAFVDYLVGRATGSAYPAVTGSTFAAAPFLLPTRDVLQAFDDSVVSMLRLADVLANESAALRGARDLLLPRLISGEVDVEELEVALPEEVAR